MELIQLIHLMDKARLVARTHGAKAAVLRRRSLLEAGDGLGPPASGLLGWRKLC
jgi:hypothetical protein